MPELVKRPRYKIGDQLQIRYRGPRWVGAVTEARGTYSPDGHVSYRIRVPMDPEPLFLPVDEEDLADPLILIRFAEEVHRLLDSPTARERFRGRCLEFLQQRAKDPDRPSPVDLLRQKQAASLTVPEKYALLAALHSALHPGEPECEPVARPEGLSWEEFAQRDPEGYKHVVHWGQLVNRVNEWLGPEHADAIQGCLEAVQADLQA